MHYDLGSLDDSVLLYHISRRVVQSTFLKEAISSLSADPVSCGQTSAGEVRKRHANLQEKVQGLWNTTNLFNKAIDHFEGKIGCCTC